MASRGRSNSLRFTAPTSRGTEPALAAELRSLGIHRVKEGPGCVWFHGGLAEAYKALLWSRVASRVLIELSRFQANHADALYAGVKAIDWGAHLGPDDLISVDFVGGSREIRHSGFGAVLTKDAICDALREATGRRPSVDTQDPDLRVHVYLNNAVATVSIDLAGRALHERGSAGRRTGEAPIKETLAAALLRMADWPRIARRGGAFVDPMCGSGTFPLEAAGMALGLAPNLERRHWGFHCWKGHDADLWAAAIGAARQARLDARGRSLSILGADRDAAVIDAALDNAAHLGLADVLTLDRRPLSACSPPKGADDIPRGLLIVNPPYGERLGADEDLGPLYAALGDAFRRRFLGWNCYVLTGNSQLARKVGLKASSRIPVWNGRIECRLLEYPIADAAPEKIGPGWRG